MDTPKAFQSFYGREPTDQALRFQYSEVCVNSQVLYERNLSRAVTKGRGFSPATLIQNENIRKRKN